MGPTGEQKAGVNERSYFPETQAIIDDLSADSTLAFECSHGLELAVGIYEVPRGCVALPGLETQALCVHHVMSNGSFEGMSIVVDLSIGAGWSKNTGEEPDYWMSRNPETGEITMLDTATHPIPGFIPERIGTEEQAHDTPPDRGHRLARFFSWLGRAHLGIE